MKLMGRTVLYIATSLDGYIAGKNDNISWLSEYQDVDYEYDKFFKSVGSIIQGRRTYDVEVREGWIGMHPVPVFVLSKDIHVDVPEGYTFANGDLQDVLKMAKKAAKGRHVWIAGGAHVGQQFLNEGLIDEIMLTIVPKLIGFGIRLFENIQKPGNLSLTNVKQYDKGLVQIIYKYIGNKNQ